MHFLNNFISSFLKLLFIPSTSSSTRHSILQFPSKILFLLVPFNIGHSFLFFAGGRSDDGIINFFHEVSDKYYI